MYSPVAPSPLFYDFSPLCGLPYLYDPKTTPYLWDWVLYEAGCA